MWRDENHFKQLSERVFTCRLLGEGYSSQGGLLATYSDLKAFHDALNCKISLHCRLADVSDLSITMHDKSLTALVIT
jgi:hypothetical protein